MSANQVFDNVFEEVLLEAEVASVLESIVEQVAMRLEEGSNPLEDDLDLDKGGIVNLSEEKLESHSGLDIRKTLSERFEELVLVDNSEDNPCWMDNMGNYLPADDPFDSESEHGSNDDKESTSARDVSSEVVSSGELDNEDYQVQTDILVMSSMLQTENRKLQQQVAKMKRCMAFVMSKYRKSMVYFIDELKCYKKLHEHLANKLKEKSMSINPEIKEREDLIAEMKQVMLMAAASDDKAMSTYEDEIVRLRYENMELRRLIEIGQDYGGYHHLKYVDESTQTTEETSASSSHEFLHDFAHLFMEQDLFPNSFEDDGESFHTANSLSGSLPSLTFDPLDGDCTEFVTNYPPVAFLADQDQVELAHTESVANNVITN